MKRLSSLSSDIFCQDPPELFTVDQASCERDPLIASLVNFAFCVGASYSDDYNERHMMMLYNNETKYFALSNSSAAFFNVKALVIFIRVSYVTELKLIEKL